MLDSVGLSESGMYTIRSQLSRITERRKRRPWRGRGLGRGAMELTRMLSTDSKNSEEDFDSGKCAGAHVYCRLASM